MRIALPPALFLADCFVRAMEGEGGCQTEMRIAQVGQMELQSRESQTGTN